jgi:hypothetical protein
LKGLKWENVDIFYGHLKYFKDVLDILWPFGTFCVHLVHFFQFSVSCTKKNLATLSSSRELSPEKAPARSPSCVSRWRRSSRRWTRSRCSRRRTSGRLGSIHTDPEIIFVLF